jgi:hypothetical protein
VREITKVTAHQIVGYSKDRKEADFYPTPTNATEALFRVEKFEGNVLEPACGDGAMSEIIKKYNFSSQPISTGYGAQHLQKMREAIPGVMLNDENRRLIGIIGAHALDAMEDRGLIMGDPRFLEQIKSTSQVLALLTRNSEVKHEHVLMSYSYALASRLGAMGETHREAAKSTEEVFSRSFA